MKRITSIKIALLTLVVIAFIAMGCAPSRMVIVQQQAPRPPAQRVVIVRPHPRPIIVRPMPSRPHPHHVVVIRRR